MRVFSLVLVVALCTQAFLANAAPNAIDDEQRVRYDGDQLWKVEQNEQSKALLKELEQSFDIELWNSDGEAIDVFVKKSSIDGMSESLLEAAMQYEVIVEDYQKVIDEENPPKEQIELLQRQSAHNLTWQAYHRLETIHSYLDYLVATYPQLCSIETIGHSGEGRALKVIKVSNGNASNKAFWMDGGIHAREWVSPASVTYLLNDLVVNWNSQPEYIRSINWYFLPVINPDGYEYSHTAKRLWRKNRRPSKDGRCHGVDINRNYGYKWGGEGTSSNPCSEIYRGPSAFSEAESTAQSKFFNSTKEKFHVFLTVHSYGQFILHPWGYAALLPPDHKDHTRAGNAAAKNMKALDNQTYRVGAGGIILYPAAGASDDWGYSIGIKYSNTIELRDTGRYGFALPASYIIKTAKELKACAFTYASIVNNATLLSEF